MRTNPVTAIMAAIPTSRSKNSSFSEMRRPESLVSELTGTVQQYDAGRQERFPGPTRDDHRPLDRRPRFAGDARRRRRRCRRCAVTDGRVRRQRSLVGRRTGVVVARYPVRTCGHASDAGTPCQSEGLAVRAVPVREGSLRYRREPVPPSPCASWVIARPASRVPAARAASRQARRCSWPVVRRSSSQSISTRSVGAFDMPSRLTISTVRLRASGVNGAAAITRATSARGIDPETEAPPAPTTTSPLGGSLVSFPGRTIVYVSPDRRSADSASHFARNEPRIRSESVARATLSSCRRRSRSRGRRRRRRPRWRQ